MPAPIPLFDRPQQPTFPVININVGPDGMQIMVVLAPGTVLTHSIGPDLMNQIMAKWREERRTAKESLETIQAIMESRTN